MTYVIRRIAPADGSVLREVRLRSLLDTPSAFARTHAEEVEYPAELWAQRANNAATGNESVYFLGFAAGAATACGMVGGYRPDAASTPDLVSMWVAPDQRGTLLASELVEHVVDWAAAASYASIELWVTRGNDRAHAFYERCGFVETGDVAPLPSDPCAEEIRMTRSLASPRR